MEIKIYQEGNKWRRERYKSLSEINKKSSNIKYGKSKNGKYYYHLIDADDTNPYNLLNEPLILKVVNERFKSKAGDKKRVLTNTVASQACCFNLFAPLKFEENKELANLLFSNLLGKNVKITQLDIEYTPQKKESIGDQSRIGGTDADLGVFYEYDKNKKGVILIEFKYIEDEFSVCSSYKNKNGGIKNGIKKKNIRPICNSENYHTNLIENNKNTINPDCGYLKYNNWELTKHSSVFDFNKIKNAKKCPFMFSLNQLWRNMLLAENISKVNKLDEFYFWVLNPRQNSYLWNDRNNDVYKDFKDLLINEKKELFKRLDIEKDFISFLEKNTTSEWNKNWLKKFRDKYLVINENEL